MKRRQLHYLDKDLFKQFCDLNNVVYEDSCESVTDTTGEHHEVTSEFNAMVSKAGGKKSSKNERQVSASNRKTLSNVFHDLYSSFLTSGLINDIDVIERIPLKPCRYVKIDGVVSITSRDGEQSSGDLVVFIGKGWEPKYHYKINLNDVAECDLYAQKCSVVTYWSRGCPGQVRAEAVSCDVLAIITEDGE